MNALRWILTVALLASALVYASPQSGLAAEVHRGHIAGLVNRGLIVQTPVYEFETINLLPSCRIIRDGEEIAWTDLRVGDAVMVTAEQRAGTWYASVIEARTPF